MGRASRMGIDGARTGLVTTLIVAAISAGSIAAAPVGTPDGGAPEVDAPAASSPKPQDDRPRYIVEARDEAGLDRTLAELDGLGVQPIDVWDRAMLGFVVALDPADVEYLRGLPDVVRIDQETVMTATETQANPPWGLDRIDQRSLPRDSGYTFGGTGAGVTLYVIDTGLRTSHTEFIGRVGSGWSYDGSAIADCNGHGTHVAGIAGGSTYGVAKAVTIIPVKVLDCDGRGSDASVIGGIDFVIAHHPVGVPAVANISIGGMPSPSLDLAVQNLINDGVTVVVAAGNSSLNSCNFSPARVLAAITVAASEIDDDDADYSNYGPCNDLFAPGTGILSADNSSDFASMERDGTSMASPHVAGAAAIILQGHPQASPADVWAEIDAASTKDVLSECCGDPDKLLYVDASAPTLWTLGITRTGGGSGTVTSAPAGISCGTSCGAAFSSNTSVTLTATPSTGSEFAGWSGACSGTAPSCVVTMVGAKSVTATFVGADALITVDPARLFDSRDGAGPRAPGSITQVQIAGAGGVPLSATGAVLNVTAVNAQAPGFMSVFPCGTPVPEASNLNYATGQTIPNAAFVRLGTDGRVCIYTFAAADLIVDVNGYVPDSSDVIAVAPVRFYDSRTGDGPRPDGSVTAITVAGRPGDPANPAAVTLNLTAVDAKTAGFMTMFPCGSAIPEASNLNFAAGQTIANAVVARVGANGQVCVFVSGTAGLLVDVNGFVPSGSNLTALNPARLLDSRSSGGVRAPNSVTEVQVAGLGGVPPQARTAMLNVTAVQALSDGFMTVFPCGTPVPTASNLNYAAGQTIANAVVAKIGDGGRVCIYTSSAAHLVVDVNGDAL